MAEAEEHHETFEKGDAGASHTFPSQAGCLKKGGFIVIKGKPCKIVDITTSKAGKHGHAKANIVGIDIFTDKKYEDSAPTSHNVEVPNVVRKELSLLDIGKDGFVTLMLDDGTQKEDLKMPDDPEMAKKLKEDFDGGKDLLLTVISAMGMEKIVSYRENQGGN